MQSQTLYEIVNKLVGPISPVGCHHDDDQRLENLKTLMTLIDTLVLDIQDVAFYKNSNQPSIKRVGERADEFLKKTLGTSDQTASQSRES